MENVFTANELMSLPEKMLSRNPSEHAASVDQNSSPSPPVTAAASSPASHQQRQPENDSEKHREFLKSRLYLACAAVAFLRGNCTEPRDSSSPPMLPERLELSDDDDDEAEETQKKDVEVADAKRARKMLSNRESARRCRRRKQAHLTEMETQISQLKDENSSLLKRLMEVGQKHDDAAVDNRILKADVETLRAKVKMAEEILKGSLVQGI